MFKESKIVLLPFRHYCHSQEFVSRHSITLPMYTLCYLYIFTKY